MKKSKVLDEIGMAGEKIFDTTPFQVLLALFLFAIALPSGAEDFCALKNTNQLVWNKPFQTQLEEFFGSGRDSFYYPDGSIYEQASAGLGGPPNDIRRLDGGLALASACRAQSCPEKAAVVIRCPNTIESVGIIHFACGADTSCEREATATLFFDDIGDRVGEADLRGWAEEYDVKQVELRTRSNSKLQDLPDG